jgi:hypothetical protein
MTLRNRIVGPRAIVTCAFVAASAVAASAQMVKKPSEAPPDASAVHGFSVALVLGDLKGGASPETLPLGARKALADMRDFLPYKDYRLLDTQWILCCGPSKIGAGISGRLRGVRSAQHAGSDEQMYAFTVTVLDVAGSQLSVRFWMNDAAEGKGFTTKLTDERAFDLALAQQEREIEAQLMDARKRFSAEHPAIKDLAMQLERVKEQTRGSRIRSGKTAVIDSTFSMDLGETVVIGTSSLKGDKALIALLTAVRRPGQQTSSTGEKR